MNCLRQRFIAHLLLRRVMSLYKILLDGIDIVGMCRARFQRIDSVQLFYGGLYDAPLHNETSIVLWMYERCSMCSIANLPNYT